MWTARNEELRLERGRRYAIVRDTQPASFGDVIHGWQHDRDFREMFNALLADAPYSAFRWETRAVSRATLSQPFEFVVLDSPELARSPDPNAFAEHFGSSANGVVTFPNLGGDAIMVVPCPVGEAEAYAHLAAFMRLAPDSQRHALWQAVSVAMARRVGAKPVWLSTAGAGVSWLHVRLDDRPKYYGYRPYRLAPV
jgi:hypothetical protein